VPIQPYHQLLAADLADGTQILNTTTRTIICPDYQFAANDPLIHPGAVLRTTAYFDVSFVITTPGTLTLDLRWGGQAGTVLATSGALAPDPTGAQTTRSGFVEFVTVWRTIGATGSAFTMGRMFINDLFDDALSNVKSYMDMSVIPTNAPAVVSSLDTTTAKLLSVCATFSVATATTQLTNHLRILESLA
jgi:hypothetical protein